MSLVGNLVCEAGARTTPVGEGPGPGSLAVRLFPFAELEPEDEARWQALESVAIEPDPCLSPYFVLPALRYLGLAPPWVLAVEQGERLLAFGLFYPRAARAAFPLPHLEAFRFSHSLQTSGLLLVRDDWPQALRALFAYFASRRVPWCALRFSERPLGGPLDRFLAGDGQRRHALSWHETARFARAALFLHGEAHAGTVLADARGGDEYRLPLDENEIEGFRKSGCYRRQWRKLVTQAKVEWRVRKNRAVDRQTVETFLHLEDQGWKRARGTSLRSRPEQAVFFREMVQAFGTAQRVYFTELVCDGEVVSSTCHLVAGDRGFAFKVAYSLQHARYSPTILNELLLARYARHALPELAVIDGCAASGDYLDALWRGRLVFTSGYLLAGRLAQLWRSVMVLARTARTFVACASHRRPTPAKEDHRNEIG